MRRPNSTVRPTAVCTAFVVSNCRPASRRPPSHTTPPSRRAIIQYRECAADDTCASVCDQVFPSSVYVHKTPDRLSHPGFRSACARSAADRGLGDEITRTKRRRGTRGERRRRRRRRRPLARAREDSPRYIYIFISRTHTYMRINIDERASSPPSPPPRDSAIAIFRAFAPRRSFRVGFSPFFFPRVLPDSRLFSTREALLSLSPRVFIPLSPCHARARHVSLSLSPRAICSRPLYVSSSPVTLSFVRVPRAFHSLSPGPREQNTRFLNSPVSLPLSLPTLRLRARLSLSHSLLPRRASYVHNTHR